jgi:hypothetical protein
MRTGPYPSWDYFPRIGHMAGTPTHQVIFTRVFCLVELAGLEPATPCLQSTCSSS